MTQDKLVVADRRAGSAATEEEDGERRFRLSLVKVAASSLAAASAAAVASIFGVAGTIIGTALFSVVATVATALYEHAGWRAADRLAAVSGPLLGQPDRSRRRRSLPWRRVGIGAALAFVVAFAGITAAEVVAGKPLSALWGQNADTGTSLTQVLPETSPQTPEPSPSETSPSPSQEATEAPSTPATSPAPTPSGSPTPTDPAPTGTPTVSTPATSPPPTEPLPTETPPTEAPTTSAPSIPPVRP